MLKSHNTDVELYLSGDALEELEPLDVETLSGLLDWSPGVSIHGPFMDLSPGATDRRIRQVTLERLGMAIELTAPLKPRAIVFHSGYEKWKYALKPETWLEHSIDCWRSMIALAEKHDTRLAIENIFETDPENLVMLMKELGSERFGICFDTGHFNLFSTVPMADWLEPLGPYIIELHLHDNLGDRDAHLPIGEGTVDFAELRSLLPSRGRDIVHTIEAHTPEDALLAIERFSDLFT